MKKKSILYSLIAIYFSLSNSGILGSIFYSNGLSNLPINPKLSALETYFWDPIITKITDSNPNNIITADANNDGYNDIITTNAAYSTISIFLWNYSIDDWNPEIRLTHSSSCFSYGFSIGDANNDGFNDIITPDYINHRVSIFPWNSILETWDPEITLPVAQYPEGLYVNDLDNDGFNDIVTATATNDVISIILWNNTLNDWDPYFDKSFGNDPQHLAIEDVNADTYNDLVISRYDDVISILLWNDSISDWNPRINKPAGNWPYGLDIGDVNNDGLSDIVATNYLGHSVSILIWNSTLSDWNSYITRSVGERPLKVFIGDANNDGMNDITVTDYIIYPSNSSFTILFWNSTLIDWDRLTIETPEASTYDISIGDVNDDMKNDLVFADGTHDRISILVWDMIFPSLEIQFPSENHTIGNTSPDYSISIEEVNLKDTWYTLEGIPDEFHFTGTTGTIDQDSWTSLSDGFITITFCAKDYAGNVAYNDVTVLKDSFAPIISINLPLMNDTFGISAPAYNISVFDPHLHKIWYSIDDNNIFISNFTGTVDQIIWESLPDGYITLRFYANNTLGNINFKEVIVIKDTSVDQQPQILGYNFHIILIITILGIFLIIRNKYKQNNKY